MINGRDVIFANNAVDDLYLPSLLRTDVVSKHGYFLEVMFVK